MAKLNARMAILTVPVKDEIEISCRMRRICRELKPMLKDMCFEL